MDIVGSTCEQISPGFVGQILIFGSFCIAYSLEVPHFVSRLEQTMQNDVDQTKTDEEVARQKREMELDQELEATFPASDALKITRTDSPTRFSRQSRRTGNTH